MVKLGSEVQGNRFRTRRSCSGCGDNGAVTTLFIIITAGILLFGTVLIDYARVATLNMMADQAVQGSVRSVLSAYDSTLYERYGLFGRGGTPNGEIFEKTIRGTLEYDGSDGRYRPVSPAVERYQIDNAAYLGRYGVLERQIAEEMKIKAPVDFMMEIGTRFGAMSRMAKETATAAEALTNASKMYDQRQQRLLHTIALMQEIAALPAGPLTGSQAAALAEGYSSYSGTRASANALAQSIASAEAAAAANAANAANAEATAKPTKEKSGVPKQQGEEKQRAEQLEADRRTLSSYHEQLSRYETDLRAAAAEIGAQADTARLRGQELNQLAIQSLTEAERLNKSIRQAAAQAESNIAAGYDRVSGELAEQSDAGSNQVNESRAIAETKDTIGQLAFDDAWFDTFRSLLQEQTDELNALTDAAYQFVHASEPALSGIDGAGELLTVAATHLQQENQSFQQYYVSPGKRISQREDEIRGSGAVESERNSNMKAAEANLNEARGLLTAASVNEGAHEELLEQFDQVQARYKGNRLFNSAAEESEEKAERTVKGAEEQAEASVQLTGGLFDGFADMLTGIRDSFYIGEYVIKRFRSYAPQFTAIVPDGGRTAAVPSYAFADQEAEYILYGIAEPFANVSAALAEIFALRYAIRLTEGFIECRALGHPLLILSGALLYASQHALADLAELKQRGATKLSKYANVDMKYNDYLRLFMLLHGGGDKRLSRIAAVIETNTGTDISRTPSAVTASADVSMKLLFLPGAMKLLDRAGLLDGRVANGRFETTKMAGLSYS
ncbi:hypothetical protein [Paenibacillus kobensis]|uniref:hypothetical protein n=1 Tax=Paenibacillus kobensis TaxID=59841 RepID=UPI000FD6F4BE|nr:hypothetical protein [Paenibacillus kobensis]